jgi:hypothetical protein
MPERRVIWQSFWLHGCYSVSLWSCGCGVWNMCGRVEYLWVVVGDAWRFCVTPDNGQVRIASFQREYYTNIKIIAEILASKLLPHRKIHLQQYSNVRKK